MIRAIRLVKVKNFELCPGSAVVVFMYFPGADMFVFVFLLTKGLKSLQPAVYVPRAHGGSPLSLYEEKEERRADSDDNSVCSSRVSSRHQDQTFGNVYFHVRDNQLLTCYIFFQLKLTFSLIL